ncbi:MAG: hypothetical protein EOM87_00365 [Clostridia bacterium]|nr:hypothetical protein [Clostridia bacterium]
MNYGVKKTLNRYAISYTIINIVFFLICFAVQRRLNITIAFLKVSAGAFIISIFITLAVTLFKMKKGNEILRIALGFVALSPIVAIARFIFGIAVFRYSFVIYLFALLCAVIYSVAIIVVATRAKKEERTLNDLLNRKDDNK